MTHIAMPDAGKDAHHEKSRADHDARRLNGQQFQQFRLLQPSFSSPSDAVPDSPTDLVAYPTQVAQSG